MKDLRRPAEPFFRSETDLDATLVSNEDSEEEKISHTELC